MSEHDFIGTYVEDFKTIGRFKLRINTSLKVKTVATIPLDLRKRIGLTNPIDTSYPFYPFYPFY
ncbi:hypothetical protein VCO01S_04120 [Vibrio comitans NBRC 102076]|uniref:Uncharacterized protein n=1 Tax=Vibrio comitans NBRC 102076 TaxID=1219078 RepID=A0A4Y3II68_9VIBR|nr:hypothetical protein VCO01S_04120 [Vibrio comitans NBRC 102076]